MPDAIANKLVNIIGFASACWLQAPHQKLFWQIGFSHNIPYCALAGPEKEEAISSASLLTQACIGNVITSPFER
jgi:hypothetical protein